MMMDPLEYNEEEEIEKQNRLLRDAFGKLDKEAMKALEEWFQNEFGIQQAAFRVFNGEWNSLDAMRQDSFQLVWRTLYMSWRSVHEPDNTEPLSYINN